MKKYSNLQRMSLSAMFLALAFVMPFLTGQIPEIGAMLCPLHIPVILCGFVCGWPWGLAVGLVAPLLRSLVLTMPPLYPEAVCMAFELATYGAIAGIMYKTLTRRKSSIYISLLTAMIAGRVVWGIAMMICLGITAQAFTLTAFIAGAFTNAFWGIVIQILLIPVLVMVLEKIRAKSKN